MKSTDGYVPSTRPWRTLLDIEAPTDKDFTVIIPAWDRSVPIKLGFDVVPTEVADFIKQATGFPLRIHARVNIGAEKAEDIKFYGPWELE